MNYGSRPSTQSLKQNLHHLPRHSLLKRSNTGNRKRRFLRESSDGVAQAQENEEEDTGEFEFHGSDYSCSRDQKQDLVVRVLSAESFYFCGCNQVGYGPFPPFLVVSTKTAQQLDFPFVFL
jgi:hypothetical protein